jgi:hypothetical protein
VSSCSQRLRGAVLTHLWLSHRSQHEKATSLAPVLGVRAPTMHSRAGHDVAEDLREGMIVG